MLANVTPQDYLDKTYAKRQQDRVIQLPGSNRIFKLCEPSSRLGRVILRLKSFPTKKQNV